MLLHLVYTNQNARTFIHAKELGKNRWKQTDVVGFNFFHLQESTIIKVSSSNFTVHLHEQIPHSFPHSSTSVQIIYNKKFRFCCTNIVLHFNTDENTVPWHLISSMVPVCYRTEHFRSMLLESSTQVIRTDQRATASATVLNNEKIYHLFV